MTTNNLVAKIWSFCDTLRDDGVSYGDYLEQITYLTLLHKSSNSGVTRPASITDMALLYLSFGGI